MVFKEINSDPSLYCNSCFSRVAKVTVRFGTVNNAIAVRLCGECYGKLLPNNKIKELKDKAKKIIEYWLEYPYHAREEDFMQHAKEAVDFLTELEND